MISISMAVSSMDKGKLSRALISAFSGLFLILHCGYLRGFFLQVKSNVGFADVRLFTVYQQNKTTVTNSNGVNVSYWFSFLNIFYDIVAPKTANVKCFQRASN